jgi:hypothetical protein
MLFSFDIHLYSVCYLFVGGFVVVAQLDCYSLLDLNLLQTLIIGYTAMYFIICLHVCLLIVLDL